MICLNPRAISHFILVVFLVFAVSRAGRADIVISATKSEPGPISVGAMFTVDFAITGYDAGPVDGFALNITYDTSIFSFVSGSGRADSGSFLDDSVNQQSGFNANTDLEDDSFLPFAGTFRLEVFDDSVGASGGGSELASGPLGSVKLMAIGLGTGTIAATAPFSMISMIFTDPDGFEISPTSTVSLGSTSMTVVPEPSIGLLVSLLGMAVVASRTIGHVWRQRQFTRVCSLTKLT